MRTLSVCLSTVWMASMVASSAAAEAGTTAVLAADLAHDAAPLPVRAAEVLRAALLRQGTPVLDVDATRRAIDARVQRSGTDLPTYQRRLKEADEALAASSAEQSLAVLEALIVDLAADPEFSVEKQALLETARMKLALRLISLAGKAETGRAETPYGKRARALLVDALRAHPALTPSRSEYPPRFFMAVESARGELAALGTGGLRVESRPAGADVYIEGRHFGQTPLVLGDAVLPRGSYRVWVEAQGARSLPKVVRIGDTTPSVLIDLAFESALWTAGPGLRPFMGAPIDVDLARTAGELLQAEHLVLVGRWQYEERGDWIWAAKLSVADGVVERTGVVRLDAHPSLEAGMDALAQYLGGGVRRGMEDRPLPPVVLPTAGADASLREDVVDAGAPFPWVPVGIAAGSVALVAAAVGVTVAIVASLPRDGAMVVTVKSIQEAGP